MSINEDTMRTLRQGRSLTARERLSLALDGVLPERDARAANACRAAMWADHDCVAPVVAQLRSLGRTAIVTVSGQFDPLHRLLAVLGVPHTVISDLWEFPADVRVVALGCRTDVGGLNDAIAGLREHDVTLITSDKSALLPALADVLQPQTPRPGRLARMTWQREVTGDTGSMLSGIRLAAGYVPLEMPMYDTSADILARDAVTLEPLIVVARAGCAAVLHSVAHWWQSDPVGHTAVDLRLVSEFPTMARLGAEFPTVRFGEVQAARSMISGLMRGLSTSGAVK